MEKKVTIGETTYVSIKAQHTSCQDCDIFKDSHITAPHQYPLCYIFTTLGKEAKGDYGLIVNYCRAHLGYIWKHLKK